MERLNKYLCEWNNDHSRSEENLFMHVDPFRLSEIYLTIFKFLPKVDKNYDLNFSRL